MNTDAAATDSGGVRPAARRLARRAGGLIGHPFVILVVGGIISVFLVPTLTRQWQERQQRFDIQQELAADITKESTTFAMALEFAYLAPKGKSGGKALDKAYLTWQVQSAVIEARLRAYYPKQPIAEQFHRYSLALLLVWSAHANREPDAGYGARLLLDMSVTSNVR